MKKGFKRIWAIIVMAMMIVTLLPTGAFKVYAGDKTRTIIIGSELELKHGIISVQVIPEGEWSVGNPEQHLHFVGEPDRTVFNVCPTIQIGPEGYEITAEEGQSVHVVWTPDPGYEYYSGSARYISVANGHVVFFEGSVGDDAFIVPDPAEVGAYTHIEINGSFKPLSHKVIIEDNAKEHGTVSGTVIDGGFCKVRK